MMVSIGLLTSTSLTRIFTEKNMKNHDSSFLISRYQCQKFTLSDVLVSACPG
jgi:hypothetical protein